MSVDASGMALYRYRRWRNDRAAPADYLKVHVAARDDGPLAGFAVTASNVNDNVVFREVLGSAALGVVRADAAYCDRACVQFVENRGGTPYIRSRRNVSMKRLGSDAWVHMLLAFRRDPDVWTEEYRRRWIVEAVFSSVKRRWDAHLASRLERTRRTEVLLKCLVYTITRAIEADLRVAAGR